jgi:hypothetical protein
LAGTLAESRHALDQSISSVWPSLSSKARCSRSHTPASCQSRSLRQHVEPDPQPISLGSISHGMPVLSTKTMPVRAARSGTWGLPPLGLGGSGGSSGSTISHSSSVTNSFAMSRRVASDQRWVLQCTLSHAESFFAESARLAEPAFPSWVPFQMACVRQARRLREDYEKLVIGA